MQNQNKQFEGAFNPQQNIGISDSMYHMNDPRATSPTYMQNEAYEDYPMTSRISPDIVSRGNYRNNVRCLSENYGKRAPAPSLRHPVRWSYQDSNRYEYTNYPHSNQNNYDVPLDKDYYPPDYSPHPYNNPRYSTRLVNPLPVSSHPQGNPSHPIPTEEDDSSYSFDSLLPQRFRKVPPEYLPSDRSPVPNIYTNTYRPGYDDYMYSYTRTTPPSLLPSSSHGNTPTVPSTSHPSTMNSPLNPISSASTTPTPTPSTTPTPLNTNRYKSLPLFIENPTRMSISLNSYRQAQSMNLDQRIQCYKDIYPNNNENYEYIEEQDPHYPAGIHENTLSSYPESPSNIINNNMNKSPIGDPSISISHTTTNNNTNNTNTSNSNNNGMPSKLQKMYINTNTSVKDMNSQSYSTTTNNDDNTSNNNSNTPSSYYMKSSPSSISGSINMYNSSSPLSNQNDSNKVNSTGITYASTILETLGDTIPKWEPGNRTVCKLLQDLVDIADEQTMDILLNNILDNLTEVMLDVFGNYFFQKYTKKCNDEAITKLYEKCDEKILTICYDNHGSRCIQSLIERTTTDYQRHLLLNRIQSDVCNMSIHTHANHVIQHVLEYFPFDYILPIIHDLQNNLSFLSSAKYGCYVLQKAFSVSSPQEQKQFIDKLLPCLFDTVNDAYGNYVIQHFIETSNTELSHVICQQLIGHVVDLSSRKMSSNVIESCLKRADLEDIHIQIVREFCEFNDLARLRRPGYASYEC
ncbi:hypothetical protein WA158_001320 [Blastocystis sp. Blastoise]